MGRLRRLVELTNDVQHPRLFPKTPAMRARIVIIGAGISGLTAAITIGEGVDKLIAAGETIARPEMTLLDAADWIGGRATPK